MQTNLTGDNSIPTPPNYGINEVLAEIRQKSLSEREKGQDFERLMKLWFLTDPRYNNLERVWLWEEFPGRKDFGGTDLGIDLVARTDTGDYWAIQCKCYDADATIDKGNVDSFLANSIRTFTEDETMQTRRFSNLIWVETTRHPWGPNAQKAITNLTIPFNKINLYELESSSVDWKKLRQGLYGKEAKLSGKQPRAHQLRAIAATYKHFVEEGNERGKLIMACGTGKTYTSLKIVEQLTDKHGFILFLVPSIALLGQTLNAWMSDRTEPMRAICICSDSKVVRKAENEDDMDASVIDLAVPASTNVKTVLRQLHQYEKEDVRIVIFSTYQSIDVVSDALHQYGRSIDLCICDEAHRTTGVKLKDRDESNFTKVHSNDCIPAHRRLYMTATPRLYRESVKVKAAENDDILCSMDDESIYGKEFHRLTFNDAVSQGLLCDYKVLVLTVSEEDIPQSMADNIKAQYAAAPDKDKPKELQFDDATKLIGCINGLSKRIKGDNGVTREQDPVLMRRAVAFCQTINPTKSNPNFSSTQIAHYFAQVSDEYKKDLSEHEAENVVNIKAQHIDGSMDAATRNEKLAWLKAEASDPHECRVLCNVRCLSEGVDVPALDAVIFLSPRNSEVEVVQSVGRVMRTFGKNTDKEKKYGYIIIPVIVPSDVTPEQALNDNERFKVVWTILNALRSHDEAFNAHVNQINLNKKRPDKIVAGGVPRGTYTMASDSYSTRAEEAGNDDGAVMLDSAEVARQLELRFGSLQDGIYAKLVEKVGDKLYWENWAKSVGEIARKFIERITRMVRDNDEARKHFNEFVQGLKRNINPSVDEGQAIEMLSQHIIMRPVFDALFSDYQFVNNNAVSKSMQFMLDFLATEGFEMDTQVLDKFYQSVRVNVGNIDNLEGKQTIIKNLYEKFFKGAFPLTVEKLGIVYTPVECVDFIIHSVEDILKAEFNTSLTEENVHILDPFVGTGTFITRLLQSGLIRKEDMLRKYRNEIHCNEIVLLAYYIADVNIESVYHDIMHPDTYQMYDGICLTDTFQLNEHGDNDIFSQLFPENSNRVLKQKKAPVRVIIGNPPYSVGQKNVNDDAANLSYPQLEKRISETYTMCSSANLGKSIYDSYIKAFRWASDRIQTLKDGGIVAFISNGAWIDSNALDGMRQCLYNEFTSIYVFNLRGNARTQGEQRRKESGNVFGEGTRTPITITFLVKNPKKQGKASIYYHDIGDYLTREQKLKMIREFSSINHIDWTKIVPNKKNDWINLRDVLFENLIPIIPAVRFKYSDKSFFTLNGPAIATGRDVWVYNSSSSVIKSNMQLMLDEYNRQVDLFSNGQITDKEVEKDFSKISWTTNLLKDFQKAKKHCLSIDLRCSSYRPFFKQWFLFDTNFIERGGIGMKYVLPKIKHENKSICISGIGSSKGFSCLLTDYLPDYQLMMNCQFLPMYYFEENKHKQKSLFDDNHDDDYIRHDGITDWILKEVRSRYGGAKNITKEMIFYYVYGLLHSKDYRERFAADLKKSLPRIPIVEKIEDFMAFYKAGKQLADLHLNYESVPASPDVVVHITSAQRAGQDDYSYFRVEPKMKFKSKEDKSVIIYNGNIRLENIPKKAYDYVVNGKSAIEWIVERYCVSTDKKSLIKNDANDWGREHGKPRYILDLLLSVVNVSVQTVDIVNSLPKLNFD